MSERANEQKSEEQMSEEQMSKEQMSERAKSQPWILVNKIKIVCFSLDPYGKFPDPGSGSI